MSDPKFIRASYDAPTRSVQYETDDGRVLVRSGGSLCWRTNNCGNLSSPVDAKSNKPAPKRTQNWIGFAEVNNPLQHFFFIFPSYDDGRGQLKASLQRKYANFTLSDTIDKYADKSDHTNNTIRYLAFIKDKTGLESGTVINTLSANQLETLLDAIEDMEGYHAEKDTQKEQWITVSRLIASDGAAPIAGAQVHIEQNGKTFPVFADAHGKLPVLPHPAEGKAPTKIKTIKPDGTWKTLLELSHGMPAKTGILMLDMLAMTAQTLSHKAPPRAKDDKIPFHYRVQPGDSLDRIANKFKTKVLDIQKLNRLDGTLIHPEQMLWIGAVGTEVNRAKARASAKQTAQAAIKATPEKSRAASDVPDLIKPHPGFLEQLSTWLSPTSVQHARSKEGEGAPLALFDPGDKRAPWMKVAIDEAKRWHGKTEDEIEKTINYHSATGTKGLSLSGRSNAWCASFVNWCLSQVEYPMWHFSMRARALRDDANFTKIEKPIYGAIALVNNHHVSFVYGADLHSKYMICVGGNQSDQINFASFHEATTYFVPMSYLEYAKKEMEKNELPKFDVNELNREFGIRLNNRNSGSTT